jgi:hypothetical protein
VKNKIHINQNYLYKKRTSFLGNVQQKFVPIRHTMSKLTAASTM